MEPRRGKRAYATLPVWVVEDHHEVVQYIYRAIASRHIPMSGVKMVHLDSHPDLLIPVNMPADAVFDKETLFSELSIENWIMPMVYAGHLSHVAWLHPYWAQQIREGEHTMCVGKDSSTTTIRVTSTDDYFLSDALYVPQGQLENPKPLHLSVIRVDPAASPRRKDGRQKRSRVAKLTHWAAHASGGEKEEGTRSGASGACGSGPPGGATSTDRIRSHTNAENVGRQSVPAEDPATRVVGSLLQMLGQSDPHDPYVLDIDLDFFSCKNPFKEMFSQEEFSILQELYRFQRPTDSPDEEELAECVDRRTRQLEDLEAAFADLLEDDSQDTVDRWAANPGLGPLARLVVCLKTRTESPDYEMVHQAGLTCDSSELPHHISSPEEIEQMLVSVELCLEALPKPTLVTISRSSLDEYCPVEQVNSIQAQVLDVLESLYGSLDVHKQYVSPPGGSKPPPS